MTMLQRSLNTALAPAFAPLAAVRRDLDALLGNRAAFVGGVAFTLVATAGLAALLASPPAAAESAEALPFEPGLMTPLGPISRNVEITEVALLDAAGDPDAPETADPLEDATVEAVTEDDTEVADAADPEPPRPRPPGNDGPRPTPPEPTPEPPSVPEPPAPPSPPMAAPPDPFGSTDGWADAVAKGDPWATAVLARLNRMRVPTWAASSAHGAFGFRLKVCPGGRIDKVFTKRPSGDPRLDAAIASELRRTELPPMPAAMRAAAGGKCATLRYTFTWTDARTR